MSPKNFLSIAPPYEVEDALRRLGRDLRIARLRRNLTIDQVAEKIRTGKRAVANAENGKPTTSIVTYVTLLWVYDLMHPFHELANPHSDIEGYALERLSGRKRARTPKVLDNDF